MSREYKEVEVPAQKNKRVVSFVCDLCGQKTYEDHCGDANWENNDYNVNVTKISREQGTSYPEGTSKDIEEWDVCPDCFDTKIRPILPPPVTSEIDY